MCLPPSWNNWMLDPYSDCALEVYDLQVENELFTSFFIPDLSCLWKTVLPQNKKKKKNELLESTFEIHGFLSYIISHCVERSVGHVENVRAYPVPCIIFLWTVYIHQIHLRKNMASFLLDYTGHHPVLKVISSIFWYLEIFSKPVLAFSPQYTRNMVVLTMLCLDHGLWFYHPYVPGRWLQQHVKNTLIFHGHAAMLFPCAYRSVSHTTRKVPISFPLQTTACIIYKHSMRILSKALQGL